MKRNDMESEEGEEEEEGVAWVWCVVVSRYGSVCCGVRGEG